METRFFAIFDKGGFQRALKGEGFQLKPGEFATEINLIVPDEVFTPQPVPMVNITVPTDALRRVFSATASNEQS